jgi:hypothetical protein
MGGEHHRGTGHSGAFGGQLVETLSAIASSSAGELMSPDGLKVLAEKLEVEAAKRGVSNDLRPIPRVIVRRSAETIPRDFRDHVIGTLNLRCQIRWGR